MEKGVIAKDVCVNYKILRVLFYKVFCLYKYNFAVF